MKNTIKRLNRQGFSPLVVLVIIALLVFAGSIGYVVYLQPKKEIAKPPESTTIVTPSRPSPVSTSPVTSPKPTPKVIDWENLIPNVRTVLKQAFPGVLVEESRSIGILKKADITGDGIPEVLVSLGTGGATTGFLALVKIENDKPVVPLFKQKDGKIAFLMFTAGAGGAGRYGSTVEMLESKNVIYSASYSKYGESSDYCRVEAYQWNSQIRIFEYNAELSNQIQQNYCRTTNKDSSQNPPSTQPPVTPLSSLPTTCIDQQEGTPVITSISPASGPIGTKVQIRGCNFTGFEGALDAVFVRSDGAEIPLYGGTWYPGYGGAERGKLITVTVQSYCTSGSETGRYSGITSNCKTVEATPGIYKVYVTAWGKKSNVTTFMIK